MPRDRTEAPTRINHNGFKLYSTVHYIPYRIKYNLSRYMLAGELFYDDILSPRYLMTFPSSLFYCDGPTVVYKAKETSWSQRIFLYNQAHA